MTQIPITARWLILADDLTGAADAGVAFASRGIPTRLHFDGDAHWDAATQVLSVDTETRRVAPRDAARIDVEAIRRLFAPGVRIFKKIDSTLRGPFAAEVRAIQEELAARGAPAFGVFAPAFPGGGRVTRDGCVHVYGKPLDDAPLGLLGAAGVPTGLAPLATVRSAARLRECFGSLRARGAMAICDAETDEDLERIVEAAIDEPGIFVGSAGLAHAIARSSGARHRATKFVATSTRGALIVVGSRARPSIRAGEALRGAPRVRSVDFVGTGFAPQEFSDAEAGLDAGDEILARVGATSVDSAPGETLSSVVRDLARSLAPLGSRISGLVVTGGETAAAMLSELGIRAIDLVDEIEPGMSLGVTVGDVTFPVITKSGAFGDDRSLARAVERLRRIRQTGQVQ